ncbi:MAG: ESX secretion-associated protein EspG [Rhodococcus sp.]|nr:ESX secretion-associated protein EspG [Rhodococcus sp. (in: high G+C Gram-positive bacteria)]
MDSTAPSMSAVTLSMDEVGYFIDKLHLDQLPVVLDIFPQYDNGDAQDAAFRAAAEGLDARGLTRYGKAIPELEEWLRVVARPRWEIALRWHVQGVVSRLCLSHGDNFSVLTLRAGDSIVIQDPGADSLGAVMGAMGSMAPMQFGTINAPTDQLADALNDSATATALTNRLDKLGAGPDDAVSVARAMSGCSTFAEIVGIVYGDGKYDPIDGPVTVFDTELGRIVGTSSVSAHGVAWSSLAPGTPAKLRQALQGLVDRLTNPDN